jgi:arsenate reductase
MQTERKRRVLFICTGNSCRSQIAEAILRHLGGENFEAHSAGSSPAGYVHPLAIEALTRLHVPLGEPVSKSWNEFAQSDMDVVITVCDAAAGEACPIWPGDPIRAHWSLPDPVGHPGSSQDREAFALTVAERLKSKIKAMLDLDWSKPRAQLQQQIARLGEI